MCCRGERRARVRGVQVHDAQLDRAQAGQRVAVNLTGLPVSEIQRGDVLTATGADLEPTYLIDAELDFEDSVPEHGDRVQVHHGTRESPARVAWLGGRFWQIRLEHQLVPARGDRIVIRQIAPPDTLGGGTVLDAHPKKHGPSRAVLARLEKLARGEDASEPEPPSSPPVAPPPPAPALPASALATEQRLRQAGTEPPLDAELDAADLEALRNAGRAVRVARNLHYDAFVLGEIRDRVIAIAQRNDGTVTIAQLRNELGTSRKFAQALLEHFDSEKLTIRRGDAHHLRRRVADQ